MENKNKENKKNPLKIILPFGLGLIIIVGGMFFFKGKKSNQPQVASETKVEDSVEEKDNKEVVEDKKEGTINNSPVLYTRDGYVHLYNDDFKLVDTIDIAGEGLQVIEEEKVEKKEIKEEVEETEEVEEIEETEEVSNNAKATSKESKPTENTKKVVKKQITENGEEVVNQEETLEEEKVDSDDILLDTLRAVLEEEEDNDKAKEKIKKALEGETPEFKEVDKTEEKEEAKPVRKDIKIYLIEETKDKLVFKTTDKRIVEVKRDGNKLKAEEIYEGFDVFGLKEAVFRDDLILLTYHDKKEIKEINLQDKNEFKYELDVIPENLLYEDGKAFFTDNSSVYSLDLETGNIKSVEIGEKTEDAFTTGDYLYLINDFGKGKDNSILLKIKTEDLSVESVVELKGKRSKLITHTDNLVYVEQMDSIKEVNIETMKPLRSYDKTVYKSRAIVTGRNIFEINDVTSIKRDMKTGKKLDTLPVQGKFVKSLQ